MTDQLTFPIHPLIHPQGNLTIQQRFEQFHQLNPWVAQALEAMTRDLLARGRQRIGLKMLVEVLRWSYARATEGDVFRLNNNYSSRYVRLLVDQHPEWAGVFETRELKTA